MIGGTSIKNPNVSRKIWNGQERICCTQRYCCMHQACITWLNLLLEIAECPELMTKLPRFGKILLSSSVVGIERMMVDIQQAYSTYPLYDSYHDSTYTPK